MKLNLTLFKNELVPVYTTDRGNKVVDARELHAFLNIDDKFATWINRKIKAHKLTEDVEFTTFSQKTEKGRPTKEYIFRLEAAKKIAMGTNNAEGDKVKDYFLACEQIAKQGFAFMPGIVEHTKRETQVENSKAVNAHIFQTKGQQDIPDYHRNLTKQVCGKTPSQLKKEAKAAGMPSKQRTSGREVLRHTNQPAACALSFCDQAVRGGVPMEQVNGLAQKARSLFNDLIQLGFSPAELRA